MLRLENAVTGSLLKCKGWRRSGLPAQGGGPRRERLARPIYSAPGRHAPGRGRKGAKAPQPAGSKGLRLLPPRAGDANPAEASCPAVPGLPAARPAGWLPDGPRRSTVCGPAGRHMGTFSLRTCTWTLLDEAGMSAPRQRWPRDQHSVHAGCVSDRHNQAEAPVSGVINRQSTCLSRPQPPHHTRSQPELTTALGRRRLGAGRGASHLALVLPDLVVLTFILLRFISFKTNVSGFVYSGKRESSGLAQTG